jgi:hypothetical protein
MASSRPSPSCPSSRPAGGAAEESRDAQQRPSQSRSRPLHLADPPSKMGTMASASRATVCAGPVAPTGTRGRAERTVGGGGGAAAREGMG